MCMDQQAFPFFLFYPSHAAVRKTCSGGSVFFGAEFKIGVTYSQQHVNVICKKAMAELVLLTNSSYECVRLFVRKYAQAYTAYGRVWSGDCSPGGLCQAWNITATSSNDEVVLLPATETDGFVFPICITGQSFKLYLSLTFSSIPINSTAPKCTYRSTLCLGPHTHTSSCTKKS